MDREQLMRDLVDSKTPCIALGKALYVPAGVYNVE